MAQLRFGFIGSGPMAHAHATVIQTLGHTVHSLYHREGSKTAQAFCERFSVQHRYVDLSSFFAAKECDAIVLCTSWASIEKYIGLLLKYPLPILVEKPVALNAHKAYEILKLSRNHHSRVMVAYNRRFYDFVPKIREAIKTGNLRSVSMILPEPAESVIRSKGLDIANHIPLYLSSHWLDLVHYLVGPLEVMSSISNAQNGKENGLHALLRSVEQQVPVHIVSDFDAPLNISITFTLEDSVWQMKPGETLTVYKGMTRTEPTPDNPTRKYIPSVQDQWSTDKTYKPGLLKQMQYFIEQYILEKDQMNVTGATLEDALYITELIENIQIQSKQKKVESVYHER